MTGNATSYGQSGGTRNVTAATVTRYLENVVGRSHEIKAGVEYEHSPFSTMSGYPGGRLYSDANGVPIQVKLFAGSKTHATSKRFTTFLQDNWSVNGRLTIQPGVRVSINRGSAYGAGTVYHVNPVDPRLGVAWDIFGNHKTVARFQYGRFHEGAYTWLFEYMDTAEQSPTITAKVLGPNDFQEQSRVTPATNFGIDPNLTQAYVDQFTIGLERELFKDFSVSAQYIRRNFDNCFAFIDTQSQWSAVQVQDPGPDGVLKTADDGAFLTGFNLLNPGKAYLMLTNPAGAYRRYDAVQFAAKKRLSHNWQVSASYTWSRNKGPVDNAQGENLAASGRITGQTGAWADPNKMININGLASLDVPTSILAQATYRVPFLGGFNVSASYRYQSGTPLGRTATIRMTQGNVVFRVEPRGARGRNDAASLLDLRLEKQIPLGARRALGIYADVFNTGNQGAIGYLEASGTTFGQPSSVSAPRAVQLGVRLSF